MPMMLHNIFSETPVVAFRRSPNLRDLLVRAKLKSPESNTLRHPPGTFLCNSRHGCLPCPNVTTMTVEPPTRSAPRVKHGRSNNTSLANQIILL